MRCDALMQALDEVASASAESLSLCGSTHTMVIARGADRQSTDNVAGASIRNVSLEHA
jgi:hypothetical protein